MFTPATESISTVAVEENLEIATFEKELDQYLGNLESKGGPDIDRTLKTAVVGLETLAGDPYPVNKEQGKPANVLKEKQTNKPIV